MDEELLEMVKTSREYAKKSYERRLFIIIGKGGDCGRVVLSIVNEVEGSVLCVSNYKRFRRRFSEAYKSDGTIISCWDTDRILGRTYDVAFIDLRDWPDVIALSRAIGTVRGGGLVFVLLPRNYHTKTYYDEIVPPYFKKPPRRIMLRRILKKSIGADGVYVYDASRKEFAWVPKERERVYEKKQIRIPSSVKIPEQIYRLAASQDQVEVLKAFERWESYMILLANRGRGKSASIGLGLTGYATIFLRKHKRPLYVCLTSRSTLNVEEVFRFAKISHDALGVEYDFDARENAFKSDLLRLEFEYPHRALKMANIADALVVDEVAAIPFPFLRKTIRAYRRIVFSGTVHGYEGTGRIFAVRFLKMLEESEREFIKIELEEPIRYSERDPVELSLIHI